MTNEDLCLRYQAGDTDAAEELVSRNKGFIHKIAEQYPCDFRNPRMDFDDYMQEGTLALLRAASQFDPSRQVPFLTYAGQAVRNAIVDAIRMDEPNMVLTPLDESRTATDDGNDGDADLSIDRMGSRLPSSYEADPETIYIRKEQLEELYAAIRSLSPRHHAWIICRYGFNDDVYKSLAEMGRIYHLSESRAKRTEDEAIGKLKKELKLSL